MTREDKQCVISICRILADKMDDSGKVAVEQVISAVKSIEEQKPIFYPQEKPVVAKTITSTDNTSGKVFDEKTGDYVYPTDTALESPNIATTMQAVIDAPSMDLYTTTSSALSSVFRAGYNIGYRDGTLREYHINDYKDIEKLSADDKAFIKTLEEINSKLKLWDGES